MQGILADHQAVGHVDYLVSRMQVKPWDDLWQQLGLVLLHFEDVGLVPSSSDSDIWHCCQKEGLALITDNRNQDGPDSLQATILKFNTPTSLPVFTIADLNKFRSSRAYVDRVVERLYEYLLDIDSVRGTGRLYLP